MIILLHIVVAMASLVLTTLAACFPAAVWVRLGSIATLATLASGTYLVFHLHAGLVQACVSGLIYLVLAGSGLAIARYRLSTARQIL